MVGTESPAVARRSCKSPEEEEVVAVLVEEGIEMAEEVVVEVEGMARKCRK